MSFYVKIDFRVVPENDIKKMPAVYKASAGIIITI